MRDRDRLIAEIASPPFNRAALSRFFDGARDLPASQAREARYEAWRSNAQG